MKHNRRILSLLLAICLVAALIPAVVYADTSVTESVQDDQIVLFGNGTAAEGTPLEWIVIENNISEMVLLLKEPMAPMAYNASGLSNNWEASDAKAWCDSEAVRELFTDPEWKALSEEKAFFLSHDEVVNYWADNDIASLRKPGGWWLRYDSNGNVDVGDLFGIAISDAGFIGTPHVAANYGVRPAIKISTSNIAMMEMNNDGKLTLKVVNDAAFKDARIDSIQVNSEYTKATATYSGALAGNKVYIVLTDRLGNVMKEASVVADSGSGSVELELPGELEGWYTVRAFLADGNVSSPVERYEFFIPDDIGNVVEWNVNLNGDVSANFNIELSEEVKNDKNAKVVVSHKGVAKEVLVDDLIEGETTGGADCVQLPVDMKAPQMNDVITIQVVSGDKAGSTQQFTIREYAEAIIRSDADEKTKDLVKHMLNYGAKAQTYFGYNANDLANAGLGNVPQVDVPNDNLKADQKNSVAGIKFYGASVVMNSTTSLRFYFTLSDGHDISEFTFNNGLHIGSKDVNGVTRYFVDIVGIAPHELNNNYDMYINNVKFVTYNPMAYIQRTYHSTTNASLKILMQAMYNYYYAAAEYEAARK